jgi:hypothetical protein
VGDDGLAFFLQEHDQPPLLLHQSVDLPRLPVEKRRNGRLLAYRGNWQPNFREILVSQGSIAAGASCADALTPARLVDMSGRLLLLVANRRLPRCGLGWLVCQTANRFELKPL